MLFSASASNAEGGAYAPGPYKHIEDTLKLGHRHNGGSMNRHTGASVAGVSERFAPASAPPKAETLDEDPLILVISDKCAS